MLPQWKLTDLAWSELKRLSDDGVALSPQDVLDIQALSLDALDSDCDDAALSSGTPVFAGGQWLFPLTVAASCFVASVAPLAKTREMETHVYAYAMAHGRDEARMRERGAVALARVREFAAGLTCTYSRELEAVLSPYAGNPPAVTDPQKEEDDEENHSIASLARAAFCVLGGDMRMYEYQMAIQMVVALLRQHSRLSSASGADEAGSPRIDALRRLGLKTEEIRARGKESANG